MDSINGAVNFLGVAASNGEGGLSIVTDHTVWTATRLDADDGHFIGGIKSFRVDRRDNKHNGGGADINPPTTSLIPLVTDFYNDTLTTFNWAGMTSIASSGLTFFNPRIVKIAYNNDGAKFVPIYEDIDSIFVDTAKPVVSSVFWNGTPIKSFVMSRDSFGVFEFDREKHLLISTATRTSLDVPSSDFAVFELKDYDGDTVRKIKRLNYQTANHYGIYYSYFNTPGLKHIYDFGDTNSLNYAKLMDAFDEKSVMTLASPMKYKNQRYLIGYVIRDTSKIASVFGIVIAKYGLDSLDGEGVGITSVKLIYTPKDFLPRQFTIHDGYIYCFGLYNRERLPLVQVKKRVLLIMTLDGKTVSERELDPAESNDEGTAFSVLENGCFLASRQLGNYRDSDSVWHCQSKIMKYDRDLNKLYEYIWDTPSPTKDEMQRTSLPTTLITKDGYIYLQSLMVTKYTGQFSTPDTSYWFHGDKYFVFAKLKEPESSVQEPPPTSFYSFLYPNPAIGNTTITLELKQASQVRLSLNDMFGREIDLIYNDFADAGTLTQYFSTTALSKGVYYLRMLVGGDIKIEKVVVN